MYERIRRRVNEVLELFKDKVQSETNYFFNHNLEIGNNLSRGPTQLGKNVECKVKQLTKRMETIQNLEENPMDRNLCGIVKNPPILQKMIRFSCENKLKFLAEKRCKKQFAEKLSHLDNQFKVIFRKSIKDLSVRPGNISCGVDGGYMKMI